MSCVHAYGSRTTGGNTIKVATDGSGFTLVRAFGQSDPRPRSGLTAGRARVFGATDTGGYGSPYRPPDSVYRIGVDRR